MSEQASPPDRRALTEAVVRDATVPSGKKRHIIWDTTVTGFGLRLLDTGTKSFFFQGRPRGLGRAAPSRFITLGQSPTIAVIAARRAAVGFAGEMARGLDPVVEKQEKKRKAQSALGAQLSMRGPYERHLEQRHLVNARAALSVLRRGLKHLMARDVDTLMRQDIVAAVDAIASSGKRGAADDLRKHTNSFFEWAVATGLAKANVLSGWRKPRRTRTQRLADEANKRRGRMLADSEIKSLWLACASFGSFGGLVRVALLTGMRRGEVADIECGFIGADRITLPPSITKTGAEHSVPITPLLREVLAAQPKTTSRLIFPAASGVRRRAWSLKVKQLRAASGVAFSMHDLRRTCRSLMDVCGVRENVAELAIGHLRVGLVALYNRNEAWALRADAFEKVAAHIEAAITGPDNVVALPTRRA